MIPIGSSLANCGIAIMAKASEPGRTKTRLVPPLTYDEAAAFNTAFLRDVADNILHASRFASIAGYTAFGPPGAREFFTRTLPAGIGHFECSYLDFGACLLGAIEQLLTRGHVCAIVLNSDSPNLPTSLLVQASEALAQPGDRMVLGPAEDGGYYLLGVKSAHRRLFEEIDWSTERVAGQTLCRAAELKLPVHLLDPWYDVDNSATLRRLMAETLEGAATDARIRSFPAEQTRRLLRSLCSSVGFKERLGAPMTDLFVRVSP
jgi:rSAM/selenodomain-associated transferase 1